MSIIVKVRYPLDWIRLAPTGDEIVVTRLNPDANIAPWAALQERGVVIRHVDFDPGDCTPDVTGLEAPVTPRTKLVAPGYASNAVGTINGVRRAVGAWVYVAAGKRPAEIADHSPPPMMT